MLELEHFHFLRPWWFAIALFLIPITWFWLKRNFSQHGWQKAVDEQLLDVLLESKPTASNRRLSISLLFGLIFSCIALAGPTWEKLPQNVEQKNDALIILLDLSLSMLAQDVQPSRFERAHQKITDILRLRKEGLTALVAYAGDAHSVVPLTDDVATIENLLSSLSPDMMPVPGSNPDHALQLAAELFTNAGLLQGRILIITDGIDNINSVSKHRHAAFPISVIGIGTEQGGPIPLDRLRQPGRFLQTQEGNQIVAMLDPQRLQDVADLTYGRYAAATLGDQDIHAVLSTTLPTDDETLDVEREFDTWYDQGHWLVIVLIPLLLLSFRRGLVTSPSHVTLLALMMLLVSLNTVPTYAAPTGAPSSVTPTSFADQLKEGWNSLWLNSNQRGKQALTYGQPEKAVTLFDDPQWRAGARYRAGDYHGALNEYTHDNSSTGWYNQGNTLARLGEYEQAIEQYNKTLDVDPEHQDALFNKALVERLLEEQQQAEQEQNQDQQSQANNEDSEQQQQNQEQQQDSSEDQQESDESEQQEQESEEQQEQEQQEGQQQQAQAEEQQATRDEKQEALEQWLRRVPDDPGGLLKRKFNHETKQRLRRGEYENRQGEKIW